jgi:hypothetical protein
VKVKAEDVAWKKIQGQVFKTPDWDIFLAIAIGSGA